MSQQRRAQTPGSVVLWAVDPGRPEPVPPPQLDGVLDPHPALLGGVHENESPSDQYAWPPRLARDSCSMTSTRLLAAVSSVAGDEPQEPGTDDDGVGTRHDRALT